MVAKTAKPLKIGLVIDTSLDPNDGVQQYVIAVGEWLRSQGHDVHYLAGQTSNRQLPNLHSLSRNVSVIFNGNRTTIPLPTSKRKLRAFIEEQQFDILHVQTPHHPLMAQRLILAASPRTAVVGTFHILPNGLIPKIGNYLLGVWLRPSLKRFDAMMAVSEPAKKFEESTYRLPANVLPNVIDYRRFHDAKPLQQNDDDVLTILFLGRLVPRKGCHLLLRAIAKLDNDLTVPKFRLVICGTGPNMDMLENDAAAEIAQDRYEFVGFVNEEAKPRYYASADIAVFPSTGGESFGIVLLEAMASGRAAVVAGDNPGYRSVMAPKPELLVDPQNTKLLAAKLKELLCDARERKAAAEWGETYTKGFDTSVVGERLLQIYEEALRKRRSL